MTKKELHEKRIKLARLLKQVQANLQQVEEKDLLDLEVKLKELLYKTIEK